MRKEGQDDSGGLPRADGCGSRCGLAWLCASRDGDLLPWNIFLEEKVPQSYQLLLNYSIDLCCV